MKLILSAGSLYTLPPTQVFEMARDVGFDGMETSQDQNTSTTCVTCKAFFPSFPSTPPFLRLMVGGTRLTS
jgi:hypothetical protein